MQLLHALLLRRFSRRLENLLHKCLQLRLCFVWNDSYIEFRKSKNVFLTLTNFATKLKQSTLSTTNPNVLWKSALFQDRNLKSRKQSLNLDVKMTNHPTNWKRLALPEVVPRQCGTCARCWHMFDGSISAVSKPISTITYTFCSIAILQKIH